MRVDQLLAGERTQSEIRLLYLADVADPALVREVRRRIAAIKIDGMLESGYLEQLITDNLLTVFPLLESTERSDKVADAVLEGRVAVLVDKSPFALIAPTTINELYQSPEDYYFNFYLGSFLRCFRHASIFVTLGIGAFFLSNELQILFPRIKRSWFIIAFCVALWLLVNIPIGMLASENLFKRTHTWAAFSFLTLLSAVWMVGRMRLGKIQS